MSSATLEYDPVSEADENVPYRALFTGSVIGVVLAAFTSTATVFASSDSPAVIYVAILNIPALIICAMAIHTISQAPDQYTGKTLATIGLVLSLAALLFGVSYGGYVYATEVPDGYSRVSFNAMRPDSIQERNGVLVPPEIAALDGKKVFIKGYIRPDSITVSKGINRFLLVRDNNQCCFGSLSDVKYFDQMDVRIIGSQTVDYSEGLFRMGGILSVHPENAIRGPQYPVYSLKADHATEPW